ncbi:hypothetical protein JCGZ_05750 [Jatropha curcas]|uniref:Aminotransferase-like plant mobile domain-containing protein n=1 Tax=Jatropha curcas TaxID=180498 RepID=A0A067KV15_JATCU|nr:hypothetical protein JCGZ_05750 [Jatropha curcas]
MEILGVIPDIPVFEGDRISVSRNALTSGTRPLQFLPALGFDFPIRHNTDAMHDFQRESCVTQLFSCEQLRYAAVQSCVTLLSLNFDFDSFAHLDTLFATLECDAILNPAHLDPVDLGKARAGGSSTDASAFWDLLDPPMRSRVISARFSDYASGLRRTQPQFPPAMCYALMERWNDCTHSFIFDFGELTLTPADFTAITGLGFDGDAVPLDARYTSQGYVSYEVVHKFWAERIRARLAAGRELPVDVRPTAPAYTREERDQAVRSFIFYIISSQLLCTSQNKGDPTVLACLQDLSLIGTYDWASLALAHLYHGLDVWTRGSGESNWQLLRPLEVWAYEYRIYPGGPKSDTPAETRRIPRYLVHCYHTNTIAEDPHYWRRYLNDRVLADLLLTLWEGDAWTAYAPRVRVEALTRSKVLLQGYWVDWYYLGERVLEIRTATAQRRVPVAPPRHMCTLDGMTPEDRLLEYSGFPADDYWCLAIMPPISPLSCGPDFQMSESTLRRRHRTPAFYEAQAEVGAPTMPTGVVLGDVPFPPGMDVTLDPTLGLGPTLAIPVPAQRYQELYQRFCFARTYIARLYLECHEMELEIGRLQRHQARQAAAVSRLQMENNRLRTRLEVEGIPLDPSDEGEDDDDDSSSDDAPPLPPSSVRQAAGPSRRRR